MYCIMTMTLGTFGNNGKVKIGRIASPAGVDMSRERLSRDLVSLDDALAAGWEPFSVLSDRAGTEVWLRKPLPEEMVERVRDPHVIEAMAHWHYSSGYRWTCVWSVSDKNWQFDLPSDADDFEIWETQEPQEVAKMIAAHLRLQLEDTDSEHMLPFKKYDIVVRLVKPGGGAFGKPMTFAELDNLTQPEIDQIADLTGIEV